MDSAARSTHDGVEVIDIFVGPKLTDLTPNLSASDNFCIMKVDLPAGVTVPVHSHEDRETFYILAGELDGLIGTDWTHALPGMVLDVKGGVRHALRGGFHNYPGLIKAEFWLSEPMPIFGVWGDEDGFEYQDFGPDRDGDRVLRGTS